MKPAVWCCALTSFAFVSSEDAVSSIARDRTTGPAGGGEIGVAVVGTVPFAAADAETTEVEGDIGELSPCSVVAPEGGGMTAVPRAERIPESVMACIACVAAGYIRKRV